MQVDLLPNADELLLVEALVSVGFGLSTEPLHEDLSLLRDREHPHVVRVDSLAGLRAQDLARKAILHGGTTFTGVHFYVAGLKYRLLHKFDYIGGVLSGHKVSKL